jgi:hypothetical protein
MMRLFCLLSLFTFLVLALPLHAETGGVGAPQIDRNKLLVGSSDMPSIITRRAQWIIIKQQQYYRSPLGSILSRALRSGTPL